MLGLWYCSVTRQVCMQYLCGESIWAGGIGEWPGNYCMHLLNLEGREINNLFFSDPSAATILLWACSLPDNHLNALCNGSGLESMAVQRSPEASSHHHRCMSLGSEMCLHYSFTAASGRCFPVWQILPIIWLWHRYYKNKPPLHCSS